MEYVDRDVLDQIQYLFPFVLVLLGFLSLARYQFSRKLDVFYVTLVCLGVYLLGIGITWLVDNLYDAADVQKGI